MKKKTCSKCREKKPVSEFYKNRAQPGGLSCWCKECTLAYTHSNHGREVRREYTQSERAKANRQDRYYLNRDEIIASNNRARLRKKYNIKEERDYKTESVRIEILKPSQYLPCAGDTPK